MPSLDASHSKTNGLEKSGNARIGQFLITSFTLWKYFLAPSFHWKAYFFIKSLRGEVSWDNLFTTLMVIFEYKFVCHQLFSKLDQIMHYGHNLFIIDGENPLMWMQIPTLKTCWVLSLF